MAKRLTDTEKWDRQWFLSIPGAYRSFWLYLCDRCDFAGVWNKNMPLAQIYVGFDLDEKEALKHFGGRVLEIAADKWFVTGFVGFQYGVLRSNSNIHASVIRTLKKHDLFDPSMCEGGAASSYIHHKIRALVRAEARGRCAYCANPYGDTFGIDHIKPQSSGGEGVFQNLVGVCGSCNSKKGSMELHDFVEKFKLDWESVAERLKTLSKVFHNPYEGVLKGLRKGAKAPKDKDKELNKAKATVKAKASVGGTRGA